MPKSGVRGVHPAGNGWRAQCGVGGEKEYGPTRATIEEAAADHAAMMQRQKAAKVVRKQATTLASAATREEHAEHLARNAEVSGGSQAKDGLARALVKLALADHAHVGVVDGVEYSVDQHLFRKQDDLGFDPAQDVELDDAVPTLALELKLTQSLQPSNDSMANPRVEFKGIDYAGQRATLVLMIYIPSEYTEATREALDASTFWWEHAFDFKPAHGVKKYTLYGGMNPASRGRPGRLMGEVLAKETLCHSALVPYGQRARSFRSDKHRRGQRAIDAFEEQVLWPINARFLPPADGCEGGAEDRVMQLDDGTRKSVQVKLVCAVTHTAGFHTSMYRADGSIRRADGTMQQLFRPYAVSDGVELFLYVLLDGNEFLAEYWAASIADLLGDDASQRLIADADGARGVQSFYVHPNPEDKERLGDRFENKEGQDAMAIRTRRWLRTLGPIVPPEQAAALKARADADRRALRLSAKAERAAQAAAAAAVASEAGPSSVTNNNVINVTNNFNFAPPAAPPDDETAKRQRLCGDLRGFFLKQ